MPLKPPQRFFRHLVLALLGALVMYACLFYAIEHQRTRAGPWQIRFQLVNGGVPALFIDQPRLGITNVEIALPGAGTVTNSVSAVTLVFDQAREVPFDVPFGRCIFLDTTTLPGTVVLQLDRHEIQLLPRVLTIDGTERRWRSQERIALAATNGVRKADPR